jgi:NADPH:quinone reductase-like Zn-dependent oxidoreductase
LACYVRNIRERKKRKWTDLGLVKKEKQLYKRSLCSFFTKPQKQICPLYFSSNTYYIRPLIDMKALCFETPGLAQDILSIQELPTPAPGPGEVRMKVIYSPINPSDLMYVQNMYGIRPVFPQAKAGFEAVGTVDACGEGVDIPLGTRASFTGIGVWAEYVLTSAKSLIPVPAEMSDEVAAQLFVNPYTAYAMVLESGVQPGQYLMLSAAGSAFGKMVIQICKQKGIKTIGTVRRNDLVDDLKALGADEIINLAEESVTRRVKAITNGEGVPCILDAVAGPSAANLLPCLAHGGRMLVYGALSLQDIPVSAGLLIFKSIRIEGFWLTTWMRSASREQRKEVSENVIRYLADGTCTLPVEAIYSLDDFKDAVLHAAAEGRSGKILIKP